MKKEYLEFLCCPKCKSDLSLSDEKLNQNKIIEGNLSCTGCKTAFPIKNYVPRFVQSNHYADSFGAQWNTFAKTQLDTNEIKESELRFKTELDWHESDLKDKMVLEFGSGAGRFVDVVSKMGAKLAVGVDVTDAVDASQNNIGQRDNVFFIQADFFELPLKTERFDNVYSIGVLHHTPDPQKSFQNMITMTKVGGNIGLSLYEVILYHRPYRNSLKGSTKELFWALNMWRAEFFRSITSRLPSKVFLLYCKYFIPVLHVLNKIPVIGLVRYFFPSTCYKHLPVEWSMLDTFDTYATKIVHQYRHKDIFHWFLREGMDHIIIHNGRAGWVSLTGTKKSKEERERLKKIEREPLAPGKTGYYAS